MTPSHDKRVSVIINNFNYARYLPAAIDSALGQDWADVEVVVVDDGSTDDSRAVIESYGPRVVAVFQANRGQSAAVNAGFAIATGDVTIFLDADDVLEPDVCRRAAEVLIRDDAVVRVQWPMRMIDASGAATGEFLPAPRYRLPEGDLALHAARFRTYIWNPTSASAYRTGALRQVLPMPEDVYAKGTGPDLYLSETIVFLGRVAALPAPGSGYRMHGDNDSTGRRRDLGEYARTKIDEMLVGHEHARQVAAAAGSPVRVPADARTALDWSFAAYRLASLRTDPARHPLAADRRLPVALRGAWSVARHPMYPASARVKRVVWLLAAGVAPGPLAQRLLSRGLLGAAG